MKKLTIEDIISRINELYGAGTFDLSESIYKTNKTKIKVYCNIHHIYFEKTPQEMFRMHSCPECNKIIKNISNNKKYKKHTEKFIHDAKEIWGNKFSYEQSVYTGYDSSIKIICEKHGPFFTNYYNHIILKQQCYKCAVIERDIKITNHFKPKFIELSSEKHDGKYDYSSLEYNGIYKEIELLCPEHGKFVVTAIEHLYHGHGCPDCKEIEINNYILSKKNSYMENVKNKYNNRYDYSMFEYDHYNLYELETIVICKEHGPFSITAAGHINSRYGGCKKCTAIKHGDAVRFTTEEFVKFAIETHGDRYDYSQSQYTGSGNNIFIICKKHGIFPQIASSHIGGCGCPACAFMQSKPETDWLNYMGIPQDPSYRNVTIKVNERRFRLDGFDPETNTIYEFNGDYFHGNPAKYNLDDINKKTHQTFREMYEETLAKEAALKSAGYKVVSIWESDFKQIQDQLKFQSLSAQHFQANSQ